MESFELDSLDIVDLIVELEEKFKINIEDNLEKFVDYISIDTINEILDGVE
ncbi:MAG: phosphopantetheine-binding protein [Mycoplasmatales bacterium]